MTKYKIGNLLKSCIDRYDHIHYNKQNKRQKKDKYQSALERRFHMENKKFAEWLIEMIVLSKQLPEKNLQDWKNEAKRVILPDNWENAEKWIDIIWKFRSLDDEAFLRFEKALEEAATSIRAV